jgi:hypothetical protein
MMVGILLSAFLAWGLPKFFEAGSAIVATGTAIFFGLVRGGVPAGLLFGALLETGDQGRCAGQLHRRNCGERILAGLHALEGVGAPGPLPVPVQDALAGGQRHLVAGRSHRRLLPVSAALMFGVSLATKLGTEETATLFPRRK